MQLGKDREVDQQSMIFQLPLLGASIICRVLKGGGVQGEGVTGEP